MHEAMDRLSGAARLLLVSDLDHTMVDHDDPENASLLRFNALWESNYRHDSILVFSTGRSPDMYERLRGERPLLTPDVVIMSVGTEIVGLGAGMMEGWERVLDHGWDRSAVVEETAKFPELKPQASTEQRPHKVSFNVDKGKAEAVIESLYEQLQKRRLDVKIIYSGGMDIDILPKGAGKGQALAYLLSKLKSKGKMPVNILACGDSGNDAELFTIPDVHGVMVSNAQEELLHWSKENGKNSSKLFHASERCAAGIIQAIGHFSLGPNISPRDVADLSTCKLEKFNAGHEVVLFYLVYERWLRAELETTDVIVDNMKMICRQDGIVIFPSGVERSLHNVIDAFAPHYGRNKGKQFRVWLDRVSSSQIAPHTWLAKFDKWEQSGDKRQCCIVTVILIAKPERPEGLELVHVHQTWMNGYEAKNPSPWMF